MSSVQRAETSIGLAQIAELGSRSLATSAEAIAAVTELVERITAVDLTVVSEITDGGDYIFRGVGSATLPVRRDASITYEQSLCSRAHLRQSPATVPDTREVPALWEHWLQLKAAIGVDWDILAFCTREVVLPDGTRFGTLCLHHLEPRAFSVDEEALLEVLARLLGHELWRERAALELAGAVSALEAAEDRRAELAEELRHELRAPLQVIDGYAEAMLDGVVVRDDEHVTLVRQEAGRAMHLLDDLAYLARLEASVPEPEAAELLNVDQTVLQMRDRLAPLAESAGIDLIADVEPVVVRIPKRRLEQFLVNLVRNALRAVEHEGGSRIVVFARAEAGCVAVGCEDDGPGITDDERPRVFDRFYRGSSGRRAASGSGLGLTIARRIAEAAGGAVAVEPLHPRGVRIVARLPAEQAGAGAGETAIQP